MKTYEFKIVIKEGNDEFWENIEGSGCEDVKDLLELMMEYYGFDENNSDIKLISYKDE